MKRTAPKGRNSRAIAPLRGFDDHRNHSPRALPWAIASRPFGAFGTASKRLSPKSALVAEFARIPLRRAHSRRAFLRPDAPPALPQRITAVDDERRAGHVARSVAGKVHRQRAKVFRFAEIAHRDLRLEGGHDLRMDPRPALVRLGHETARQDRVDGDAV